MDIVGKPSLHNAEHRLSRLKQLISSLVLDLGGYGFTSFLADPGHLALLSFNESGRTGAR